MKDLIFEGGEKAKGTRKNCLFKLNHNSFHGKSRGVNVKINIKNKCPWINKNAVQLKFRMFIIRSIFLARKLYGQRM